MPHPPDKLGEPLADLPNPELNPLLNPVLGRHLGQWAHVYFTTPPEKREEALFELVDDLKSQEESTGAPDLKPAPTPQGTDGMYAIVCPRCERSNLRSQKYCGMCGALMPVRAQAAAASANQSSANPMFDQVTSTADDRTEDPFRPGADEVLDIHRQEVSAGLRSPFASTSLLFQPEPEAVENDPVKARDESKNGDTRRPVDIDWLRERKFANQVDDGGSRWVTYLMGTAILLCIGMLTFLLAIRPELRGKSVEKQKPPVNWNITQNAPTQVPSVEPDPASISTEPNDRGTKARATNPSAPLGVSVTAPKSATAAARKHLASEPTPTPNLQATPEGGAAELAVARDYLSGKNGPPDGQGAAQMLWKAIAKKNGTALLVLSDLYASGNGVAKSCDQARLLLDAALQKNVPTADYKLKILQQTCR